MDFKQNCSLRSFLDGVQMESRWIYGVHVESVGEGEVQLHRQSWPGLGVDGISKLAHIRSIIIKAHQSLHHHGKQQVRRKMTGFAHYFCMPYHCS